MRLMDQLRGSGRTYNMLTEAEMNAFSGAHVLVYGATYGHARQLFNTYLSRFRKHWTRTTMTDMEVQYGDSGGVVQFRPIEKLPMPWDGRMPEPGLSRKNLVLFDHYAIEDKFPWLVDMLHRYDGGGDYGI